MEQTFHKVVFAGNEYKLPLARVGKVSIAVFDSYQDIQMCRDASKDLYEKMKKENITDMDYIIGIEIKGAAIAQRIADLFDKPMVVFRKSKKINFTDVLTAKVETVTSGHNDLYIDKSSLDLLKGKKICLVDDVVSSGSSVDAVEKLLNDNGIQLAYKAFVFKEGEAYKKNCVFVDKLQLYGL